MYAENKYNDCDSGFNDAVTAEQKTTPQYQYGLQAAKRDSIISVYDSTDVCAIYKGDANTNCLNGYSTTN
ncbi:MAG: hypothetical protein WBZ36_20715 [Candidatus Nitrosopolaris sp.]